MALDFQIEPFFDDYTEDKKFYRILFRPGYAVQARELSQMQTILQEQVRRHGDHIFKEGSMVIPGQISLDLDVYYIKLVTDPAVNTENILSNLVGKTISDGSDLKALVVKYARAEGTDPDVLFVKYLTSKEVTGTTVSQFQSGDTLNPVDGTTGLQVIVGSTSPVGKASLASIQRGIYYINKHFVLTPEQTIVLDKFSDEPSYRIGLELSENIVYPEDDESLLDNALGSPNYAAPGAARYYMDLVLTKLSLVETSDAGFIELMRVNTGKILFKVDKSQYAELEKTLARRTYDESGDYSVTPFGFQIREYRNNYRGTRSNSEKYIQGDIIKITGLVYDEYYVAVKEGTTAVSSPSFSPTLASVNDGSVIWEYTNNPQFNNGIYTFSSGDPEFSAFTLNDHRRLDGMFAVGVEPAKAYVRGYEIEKIATEYIGVEKSRDFDTAGSSALATYLGVDSVPSNTESITEYKTANIDLSSGSYVVANNLNFAPTVDLTRVNLHSVTQATASTGTIIGSARVKAVEFHASGQYKVFLMDIVMNSGRVFSEVKSVWTNASSFMCDMIQSGSPLVTTLINLEQTSLLYPLPDYAVKNINEVTYSVVVQLSGTSNGSGVLTLAPPSAAYAFESVNNVQNYVVINNSSGAYVTSGSLSISSGNLVVSGLTVSTSFTVLATMKRADSLTASSKVTVTDLSQTYISRNASRASLFTLNKPYVTRLVSVRMDPRGYTLANGVDNSSPADSDYTVNITSRYVLDDGQNHDFLGFGTVRLISGQPLPIGPIKISYEYLDIVEVTPGDFLAVNSYTHATSELRYDQIPYFQNSPLRDFIDFRPIALGGSYITKYLPKFGTTASIEYRNYKPRVDNIALNYDGTYAYTKGVPSFDLPEPNIPNASMKLATLTVSPYTFNTNSNSISVKKIDNKRYTMRDIGKIERRVEDLEHYTSLSLSELDTKNTRIIDSSGLDRYQNGFIVDTFDSQRGGNARSSEWMAAIDTDRKELRPFFSQQSVPLFEKESGSPNYEITGDLVTLPYTETVLVNQPRASTEEPIDTTFYNWRPSVQLTPWSDAWFEVDSRPDVVLSDTSAYEALISKAEKEGVLGTIWNSWQKFWSGVPLKSTQQNVANWGSTVNSPSYLTLNSLQNLNIDLNNVLISGAANYSNIQLEYTASSNSSLTTQSITATEAKIVDDRFVSTSIIPYVKSRKVLLQCTGLKQNNILKVTIDDIDVDAYIAQAVTLKVSKVVQSGSVYYPHLFNTSKNAGFTAQNQARLTAGDNSENVELAFTRGEVIKEYNASNVYTGNSAIVVGQEFDGIDYYIHVVNLKQGTQGGGASLSTATGFYLQGEDSVNGNFPRVKLIQSVTIPVQGTFKSTVSGQAFGILEIPNNAFMKFRTGSKQIKVRPIGVSTNAAYANYEALGAISSVEKNIISTRSAYLSSESYFNERSFYSYKQTAFGLKQNPLSQTFIVNRTNGAFLTSVELYFKASSGFTLGSSSTGVSSVMLPPVTVDIREVVNGYPSSKIIPFSSTTLRAEEIKTSNDASVSTKFVFPSPVYLQDGVEYALCVTSDNQNFTIWTAEIGKNDIITGAAISSQPYGGVLFKPSNSTEWNINQTQDLKFVMNCASFSASATIEFVPALMGYKNLDYNPFYFTSGSRKIRVSHKNHGLLANQYVMFKTTNSSMSSLYGIPVGELFNIQLTVTKVEEDYYIVESSTTAANATGNGGGNGVSAKSNVEYQTAMLDISQLTFPGTEINYTLQTINGSQNINSYSCSNKENMHFNESKFLMSQLNYVGDSIKVTAQLKTTSITISPVIDLSRIGMILVNNKINSPSISVNEDAIDATVISGSTFTITNVARTSGVVTVTTSTAHGLIAGQTVLVSATTNAGINGSYVIASAPTTTTFTYSQSGSPVNITSGADTGFVTLFGLSEIGAYASGKTIELSTSGSRYTIRVNSVNFPQVYTGFDLLDIGYVVRFTYNDLPSDQKKNMVVVDKYYDTSNNVYLVLEAETSGSSVIVTTSNRVTVEWMTRYFSDVSSIGSTISKYVTKKINLTRSSEMLRIMFSALVPIESEVEVYYKTSVIGDTNFARKNYVKVVNPTFNKSDTEFAEIVIDVESLDPFDTFMVKLCMKSTSKAKVPRIKNLRIIACAA